MARVVLLCCATLLFHISHSQSTIDVTEPIVRVPPATLDEDGYFGYSVVLHRKSDGPRIIVSAPNGTAENGAVENLGVLFECPISQGICAPLVDTDATGNDRRLYDVDANDGTQVKENQFLGVSMESEGNFFLVCGHRYIYRGSNGNQRYPIGRCYYTGNEDLVNFQVYEPCRGRNTRNYGSCQVGTSASLARINENNVDIALGAPGTFDWTGSIYRRDSDGTSEDEDGSSQSQYWQGYAITKGHLISPTEYHFAVSVPRSFTYTGNINIYSNTPELDITMQELRGMQMGEYYGFSLATADLNGDGYDELIVGAPMYSIRGVPETGRIYIYLNTQGSLSFFATITGDNTQSYTRFGHAIANLGDVNGDGFEDIAVSAPFGSNPGTVYIYHGSLTLTQTIMEPAQVIRAEEIVMELSGVDMPVGFGSSLASSFDVDDNQVNDLAVGAFQSQQVFLFRSRATARVSTQLRSTPAIVDLMNRNCTITPNTYACFDIQICATYPTSNLLPSTIEVNYTIVVDDRGVQGLEERVFFEETNNNMIKFLETLSQGVEECFTRRVFIINDITDIFNGFGVSVLTEGPTFVPNTVDGNPDPTDFSTLPIVVSSPEVLGLQVELFNDCDGQVCVPDLAIEYGAITYETSNGENTDTLVAGLVTNFNLPLTFSNLADDDAFSAELEVIFSAAHFDLIRLEPTNFLIARPPTTSEGITTQMYLIGNPLEGNQQRSIGIRFRPLNTISGNEGSFNISLRATSINAEDSNTQGNNRVIVTIPVNARADVTLDQAVADPEQLTYNNSRVSNISTTMDLGPGVTVSFLVLNRGPSTIPNTRMSIFWPYRATDSDYYYLYPAQLMIASRSASVTSSNTFINPDGILLSVIDDDADGDGIQTEGKKKRRRRSLAPVKSRKRPLRHKRQMDDEEEVQEVEVNDITVDCRENNPECVELTFTIVQLPRDSSVQIDVVSYLDERYFENRVDRFTFIAHANLSIDNPESAFIVQPSNDQSDEIDVQVRVVPIIPITGSGGEDITINRTDNLLAIILPIVFGLIFLVALGIVLYFVGFFKRKHKQRKEEIQAEILAEQQGEFPTQDGGAEGKD